MKFSTITALAVLGSNAVVAAYEIPNNKVIGKIVDEYLEQDPEGGEWSQECRDESAGVQVCVVAAVTADPAWGTRVGQAGETLEACTKGWTITDQAEWEKCLTPYFTLLSEKCDLSASLEACFGEDVHFAAEAAQDIEYAAMIATDAAFLEEEPVEEDPCDIESDVLQSCVSLAVEADAAWGAVLEEAWETVDTCGEGLADDDEEAWTACLTPLFKIIQQKCDTTDYIATCTVSDAQDFVFDITILDSEGLSDDDLSQECLDESAGVQVCVVAAVTADPAWGTRVEQAGETLEACTKGWTITEEDEWRNCLTPWITVLSEKCDLSASIEACGEEDVHFIADFVEDLELDMIAAEVVADEFVGDDGGDDAEDSFELPEGCEEEWEKVEVCIGEAGEADAAWLAALTSAEEEVSACITALYEEGNITAESVAACMEDATVLLQQKCDTTAAEEACTPSEILDFHLDLAEELELDIMIEQAGFLQEDPVDQCDVEWEALLTCVDDAALSDEAWAATYEATVDTYHTCSEGLVEGDEEGDDECVTPWFIKVSEKCDIDTLFAACDEE